MFFHNFIAHPVMAILQLIGLKDLAAKIHDSTCPQKTDKYAQYILNNSESYRQELLQKINDSERGKIIDKKI